MFQGENNPYSEASQSIEVPAHNDGEDGGCTSSDCQSNQSESSTDSRGRLSLLETELQARTRDLDRLKFKIDKMKSHQMSSPTTSRREAKPINIKIEVERLRKDKKVMAELLKQSQQELTRKDSINRKLKMENDKINRNMVALQSKLAENGRTQNLLEELNRVRNELSLLTSKPDRRASSYQGQTTEKDDKGRYIEELVMEKEQLKQCLSAIYFKITPYAVSLPSRSATPPVWAEDVKNTFDQFWEEKIKLQRELEELREQLKSREATSAEPNRTSPECYETTVSDCSTTDSKSDYLSDATIVKVSRTTAHHNLESEVCRWKEMYQNVYDKYRSAQHTITYHEKKFKKIYSAIEELTKNVCGEENCQESVSGYNMTKVMQRLSEEYKQLKESVKRIKHEEQHQTDLQNSIIEAEKILEEKGRNARTLRNAIGTLQLTSNMETKVASLAETMLLIYNNQLSWLKQLEHNNTLPNSEGEETHSNSPNQCDIDLPMQDYDKVDNNRLNCGDAMSCSSESNESSTSEGQEVIHKPAPAQLNVECSVQLSEANKNQSEKDNACDGAVKSEEEQGELKIENTEASLDENKESQEEEVRTENKEEEVTTEETNKKKEDEVRTEEANENREEEIRTEETNEKTEEEGSDEKQDDVEKQQNKSESENVEKSEGAEQQTSDEVKTESDVCEESQADLEKESSQKEQMNELNENDEEIEAKDSEKPEDVKNNEGNKTEKDNTKNGETSEDVKEEKVIENDNTEENEEEEKKDNGSDETKNSENDGKDDKDDDDKEQNNSNAGREQNTEDGNDKTEESSKDDESKDDESKNEDSVKEDNANEEKEKEQTTLPPEQSENDEVTEIDESCGNEANNEITVDTTEDKETTADDIDKNTSIADENEMNSKIESEQNIEDTEEEKSVEEPLIVPINSKAASSVQRNEDSAKNNEESASPEKSEDINENTDSLEKEASEKDESSLNSKVDIEKDKESIKGQDDDPSTATENDIKYQAQTLVHSIVQSVVAEIHNSAEIQEYITDNVSQEDETKSKSDQICTVLEADEENEEGKNVKDSAEGAERTSEVKTEKNDVCTGCSEKLNKASDDKSEGEADAKDTTEDDEKTNEACTEKCEADGTKNSIKNNEETNEANNETKEANDADDSAESNRKASEENDQSESLAETEASIDLNTADNSQCVDADSKEKNDTNNLTKDNEETSGANNEAEGTNDADDTMKGDDEISEANDQSESIAETEPSNDLNTPDNNQCADGAVGGKGENKADDAGSEDHENVKYVPVETGENKIVITEADKAKSEASPCSSLSHSLSTEENKDNIKIIVNPASSEEHESITEDVTQSNTEDGRKTADEESIEQTNESPESKMNDENAGKSETEMTPVVEQEITKVVIEPKKTTKFFSSISAIEKDAASCRRKGEDAHKQSSDEALSKRIEELETEMSEMLEVKQHHMKVACDLAEKLEEMKKRELDLQDQLSNAETKSSQEVEVLTKEWSGREQSYQDEIAAWKENVEQQNSVLQRLKADLDQAQQMAQMKEDEIEQLRSLEREKRPEAAQEQETQTSDQEEDPNNKELQETVDRLRITSEHYQQQLMENRTVVREVKSIIEGSVAQLVTLKAMGTKHMKREYVYRNNLAQKELDLKHLQSELDKQSIDARAKANIIEKQRNEIRSLREELRKCQKDISAKVEFIDELQEKMQKLISSQSKPNSANPEDLELYTIGRRCIEEQHTIQLEKKKEELERMRHELHLLEMKCSDIDSAAESSDQQNMSHPGSAGSVGSVSEELPGGSDLCLCKRKDVHKILKLSEESYLNLLASLVVCLGIQDMKYNKSMQRLSWSQCKDISSERKANQKRIMKVIQDLKKEERTVSPRLQHPERSRSTGETEKRRGLIKCISPQNGRSMYITDMIRQAEENLDKDKPVKIDGRKPASWRPHTSMNERRVPLELKNGEILALLGNADPKTVPKPALSSK